jgi:hypothetical protein
MIGKLMTVNELIDVLDNYSDNAKNEIIKRENEIESVMWDSFVGEFYLEVPKGMEDIVTQGWEFYKELENSSLYIK